MDTSTAGSLAGKNVFSTDIWGRDVTNDVVTVDANLGQLLNQPFRLVQASMENNLSHQIGMS